MDETTSAVATAATPVYAAPDLSTDLLDRYRAQFGAARSLTNTGGVLKGIAIMILIFTVLGVFIMLSASSSYGMMGLMGAGSLGVFVSGFLMFAIFLIAGLIVAGLGQILKANVESAVNTSPFLTNDQRAAALRV